MLVTPTLFLHRIPTFVGKYFSQDRNVLKREMDISFELC